MNQQKEVDDYNTLIESLTAEQREVLEARQQFMSLLVDNLAQQGTADICFAQTRKLLESVKENKASTEERQLVTDAVQRLSKRRNPRKNSQVDFQAYLIALKYLTPEKPSSREIARITGVDFRTVCRQVNIAIERLSIQLFGIDALKLT